MDDRLRDGVNAIIERLPTEAREAAEVDVEQLVSAGVRTYRDLMRLALDDQAEDSLRVTALWVLARVDDSRGVAALSVALDDQSGAVRSAAAKGLGDIDGALALTAVDTLIERLNDREENVRQAAAYALGLLGSERAVEPLVARLASPDESETVRGVAAEALGDIRAPRATPALLEALEDTSAEVRFWASFALGEIGDPRTLIRLNSVALTDEAIAPGRHAVAAEAAAAMARIEERARVRVLGVVRGASLHVISPPGTPTPVQLTTISSRLAQDPAPDRVDLSEYADRALMAEGYVLDMWLYDAKVIEVGSPLVSALVGQIAAEREGRNP